MGNAIRPVTADGEIIEVDERLLSIPFLTDEAMQAASIDQAFDAPDLAAAMRGPSEGLGLDEFSGHEITIHSAGLRPSYASEKVGVFAIMRITDEKTGEQHVVTCGSVTVLAVLARAYKDGKVPFLAKALQAAPTIKGRSGQLFLTDPDRF